MIDRKFFDSLWLWTRERSQPRSAQLKILKELSFQFSSTPFDYQLSVCTYLLQMLLKNTISAKENAENKIS